LEQYNDSLALDVKSCNGSKEGKWLSFRLGALGIERIVGEKIVITSFGGVASHRKRAPSVGATHARTTGALADRPLRGADLAHTMHRRPYPCAGQT